MSGAFSASLRSWPERATDGFSSEILNVAAPIGTDKSDYDVTALGDRQLCASRRDDHRSMAALARWLSRMLFSRYYRHSRNGDILQDDQYFDKRKLFPVFFLQFVTTNLRYAHSPNLVAERQLEGQGYAFKLLKTNALY